MFVKNTFEYDLAHNKINHNKIYVIDDEEIEKNLELDLKFIEECPEEILDEIRKLFW